MILDFLFPKKCLGCGKMGSYVCNRCLEDVPKISSFCFVCGRPSIDGVTHFKCKKKLSLDGVVAIWSYTGVLRKAILALKYKFAYEAAEDLVFSSFSFLESNYPLMFLKNVLLVSIPTAKKRNNWRGFNQTEIMGRMIAKHFGWKFSSNLLLRRKFFRSQTELKGKERRKNIKGAFEVNPQYKKVLESNPSIVIFDDVLTTGSTLKEAGKVLKRKGFKNVWGLVLAKS
jgi:ComF family protein